MYLSKLQVQHYKSLDDASVDFAPDVTLVVGPNGVGKSNFVDVLRFLRDAVVEDLERAVTKREGIQRLLQTYKTKPFWPLRYSTRPQYSSPRTPNWRVPLKRRGLLLGGRSSTVLAPVPPYLRPYLLRYF